MAEYLVIIYKEDKEFPVQKDFRVLANNPDEAADLAVHAAASVFNCEKHVLYPYKPNQKIKP